MRYVVKASGGILSNPHWLSTPWSDGFRDLIPLDMAQLAARFQTAEDARAAVDDLAECWIGTGTEIVFDIEQSER